MTESVLDRRKFLLSSTAATLAGCGGVTLDTSDSAQRWPPLGKFVDLNGLKIHAWDKGGGQPVILLHGASGNLRDWTFDLAPKLATQFRTIAFDRPGLGYSDRPAERGGDPAVQARVLQAASRAMGIQKPILVGHSLGAAIAMAWALSSPDDVAGVVTVSGAVMPWSEKPMLAEMVGLDELLIGFYMSYLESSAARGGIKRFVSRIFRPQTPPQGYLEHVGGPLALTPKALEANKDDIATLNTALRRQAPDYRRISVPVEVISGTADFIIAPERQPIPFAESLPVSKLTLLKDVGHMAHHAGSEVVRDAIARIATQTA
jgi:pimeloyl-ACP methyl ester carboxylesterase